MEAFDQEFELDDEHFSSTETEASRLADLLSLDEPLSEQERRETEEYYEERISEREQRIKKARWDSRAWAQQVLQVEYERYRSGEVDKDHFLHGLYWYLQYQVANKHIGPLPRNFEKAPSLVSDTRIPDEAYDVIADAWLKLKDKIDDYEPRTRDGKRILLANWINVVLLNQGRDNAKKQRREEFRKVGIVDSVNQLEPGTLTSDRISFLAQAAIPEVKVEISKNAGYTYGNATLMSYVGRYLSLLNTDLKAAYPDYATILHAIIYTEEVYTKTGKVNIAELTRRLKSGQFAQIDPENPIKLQLSEKAVRTRVDDVRILFVRFIRHLLDEQEKAKVDAAIKRGEVYTPQNFDDPGVFERARKQLMKTKADHEFKPHLPTEKGPAKADEIEPEALELNGRFMYRIKAKKIDPNHYLGGLDTDQ